MDHIAIGIVGIQRSATIAIDNRTITLADCKMRVVSGILTLSALMLELKEAASSLRLKMESARHVS